jgi:hypothetical protein
MLFVGCSKAVRRKCLQNQYQVLQKAVQCENQYQDLHKAVQCENQYQVLHKAVQCENQYQVLHKAVQCENPNINRENVLLPAANDIVRNTRVFFWGGGFLGAKQLPIIPSPPAGLQI